MPRIFDNIETKILGALRDALTVSQKGDFCVGYFNLRGWKSLDDLIDKWPKNVSSPCRLLVGMQRVPRELVQAAFGIEPERTDQRAVARLKKQAAEDFRDQLCMGIPTADDEAGLRRLAAQLRDGKVSTAGLHDFAVSQATTLAETIQPRIQALGERSPRLVELINRAERRQEFISAPEALRKCLIDRIHEKYVPSRVPERIARVR